MVTLTHRLLVITHGIFQTHTVHMGPVNNYCEINKVICPFKIFPRAGSAVCMSYGITKPEKSKRNITSKQTSRNVVNTNLVVTTDRAGKQAFFAR